MRSFLCKTFCSFFCERICINQIYVLALFNQQITVDIKKISCAKDTDAINLFKFMERPSLKVFRGFDVGFPGKGRSVESLIYSKARVNEVFSGRMAE